jgi:hypothetical protein
MELNQSIFIGKTKTAPVISEKNGQKQAYVKFTVKDRAPGANGQWVDTYTDIDVFAEGNKAPVFENHVVMGQELTIICKYVNWVAADGAIGHAFRVQIVSLGFKPKGAASVPNVPAPPL